MVKKNQNGATPQPTAGSEWRRPREVGTLLQLPSGKWGRFRPVDFTLMVRLGRLPDSLTSLVVEVFKGGEGKVEIDSVGDVQQYVDLMNTVTRCAFVSPRVVDDPQMDDEIHIDDVEEGDKAYLLWVLNKSAKDLESFRQEQDKLLESLRDGDGDGQVAEPDIEPEGMGPGQLSA